MPFACFRKSSIDIVAMGFPPKMKLMFNFNIECRRCPVKSGYLIPKANGPLTLHTGDFTGDFTGDVTGDFTGERRLSSPKVG